MKSALRSIVAAGTAVARGPALAPRAASFFGRSRPANPATVHEGRFPLSAPRTVPAHIPRPPYVTQPKYKIPPNQPPRPLSATEIAGMRRACRLAANTLQHAVNSAKVRANTPPPRTRTTHS